MAERRTASPVLDKGKIHISSHSGTKGWSEYDQRGRDPGDVTDSPHRDPLSCDARIASHAGDVQ